MPNDIFYLDVYDPLLFGQLSSSSPARVGLKDLSLGEEEKSPMPSPGEPSAGRSYDGHGGRASDSSSRTSGSQRSTSQQNLPRRQQGRQSYTAPSPYYPSSPADSYQTSPPTNQPSQAYPGAHGSSTYSQRPGFPGQYTMSQQPPPQSLFSSQTQYAYSHPLHHSGLHSPDGTMPTQYPSIGYSAPPLAPPVPSRPLYPFQRFSPDGSSSSSASFPVHTSAPPEHAPISAYDPSPPSGSPHPSQTTSPYTPQHASPFPSFNYPTVTATPQFTHYPRDSFTHSTPSMYHSQYPHSYATPPYIGNPSPDDSQHQGGGTWFYVPQTTSPAGPPPVPTGTYDPGRSYQGLYPVPYPQMGRPELDAYGNPTTASTSGYSLAHPHASAPPSFSASSSGTLHRPQSSSHSSSAKENLSSPGQSPVSPIRPLTAPSGGESGSERSHSRRPYLPNPPAQRSKWVMWVGNVPGDATHDELWRFFTQSSAAHVPQPSPINTQAPLLPAGLLSPEGSDTLGEASGIRSDGVASIFLISRSNCAFVNYVSEAHLMEGVRRFNGIPLRPGDPRCQKLVCRVRGEDDDMRAGVGGQRGVGMHVRYVKDQKERDRARQGASGKGKGRALDGVDTSEDDDPPTTPSESSNAPSDSPRRHRFSSDDDGPQSSTLSGRSPKHQGSSSGSYASTNSGFLQRHFPTRFFILKSSSLVSIVMCIFSISSHYLYFGDAGKPGDQCAARFMGHPTPQRGDSQPSVQDEYQCLPYFWRKQKWRILWLR